MIVEILMQAVYVDCCKFFEDKKIFMGCETFSILSTKLHFLPHFLTLHHLPYDFKNNSSEAMKVRKYLLLIRHMIQFIDIYAEVIYPLFLNERHWIKGG